MISYLVSRIVSKFDKTSSKPAFCIKKNYRHRLKLRYFLDNVTQSSGIIWQPEIYEIGSKLGKKFECNTIIDMGCGYAEKLVKMYPKFNVIGIDFGKNIQHCKNHFDFGKWIEADLESGKEIEISKDVLEKSVLICSDVIEHIINPSNLLKHLKKFLDYCPVCILSTPERDLTRGKKHLGPPSNPHHVREWSLVELRKLLESYNFKIGRMGLTASENKKFEMKTIIAVLYGGKLENENVNLNKFNFQHTSFRD